MEFKIIRLLTGIIILVSANFGKADDLHHQQLPPSTDFKKLFQEWDDSESIRKSHLKVYGMNYPPVMIPIMLSNDTCINNRSSPLFTYSGTGGETVDYLAQHYELTVEYIQEDPSEVAKFGQTQALINAIISGKVDFCPFGMTPTPERMKLFDLTSPVFCEKFNIMVRWPEESSRLTLVARPFDWATWSMIAVSFLFVIGMLSLLVYFRNGHWNFSGGLYQIVSDKIMFVIGITTNHSQSNGTHNSSRFYLRIMLGLWLLMMVVIINSYTSVLTSLMAVPKLKPIPQSLEDLAEMKEYKVTIQKNQILAEAFLKASSGTYKILGDTLRQHPELLFSKFPQAVENVLKYGAANVDAGMITALRIGADMKTSGKCRLTASNPIFHTQSYATSLPKNSRFTKAFDRDQWRLIEAGLYNHWKKVYIPSIDKCNLNNYQNSQKKAKPIRLIELSSAFFIFGIGIGLSILVFLLERIVYFGRKIRNEMNVITI